jgi:hypothetical protein
MTTLADMQFEDLEPGMKFRHPEHGDQVILDLGRGKLGPAIRFDSCAVYSGEIPQLGEEEGEVSIFQLIAQNTYPHGADQWEYLGKVEPEDVTGCGWHWFEVGCPHCGFVHRWLSSDQPEGARTCRSCGMVFIRPAEPVEP